MSAPTSSVDICNIALDHIGERAIASIDAPTTSTEVLLSRHYDQVRRELLRSYVWNFAVKRETLSRSGTPAFDYTDAYTLPNDFLRLLRLGTRDLPLTQIDYDIEGTDILVNNDGATGLRIRFIRDVTLVTSFDPLFVRILSLKLALAVGYKITNKKGVVSQVNDLLTIELPKAISIDGQERPPRKHTSSNWLARRMGAWLPSSYDNRYHRFTS